MTQLSIIIPAYNEAPTLRQLVEKILTVDFGVEYEVLIIDDHSQDQTHQIADSLAMMDSAVKVRIFHNELNRGKGYSIQRGFANAKGKWVIVQDADFEYDPQDIARMLRPLVEGRADMVFGSRFMKKGYPAGMALPNMVANRLLTWVTNLIYGTRLTDVYSCYKLIPLAMIQEAQLKLNGFESEAEILSRVLVKKKRVLEIPISYHGRTAKEGKKIKGRDFFTALEVLFKNRK